MPRQAEDDKMGAEDAGLECRMSNIEQGMSKALMNALQHKTFGVQYSILSNLKSTTLR
jgi:hypothetical protein